MKENEPLAAHTTFGIGGPARWFIEARSHEQLRRVLSECASSGTRVFVLGGGSNILFSDDGYDGVVVRLAGDFARLDIAGDSVTAGAAVPMHVLVRRAADDGLSGLEGMAGIPGTFGGAIAGNAGTALGWIGEHVVRLEAMDQSGGTRTFYPGQFSFSYRGSSIGDFVITRALLSLKKARKNDIVVAVENALKMRMSSQPITERSAGCVFKNPPDHNAGRLIDQAGAKGMAVGGARVSDVHANFIVNTGGASAADVLALAEQVRARVLETAGLPLEFEIRMVR